MEPVQGAANAHTGFIGMGQRCADQRLANGCHGRLQACGSALDGAVEAARGDGDPGQLIERIARRRLFDQLETAEADVAGRLARGPARTPRTASTAPAQGTPADL